MPDAAKPVETIEPQKQFLAYIQNQRYQQVRGNAS